MSHIIKWLVLVFLLAGIGIGVCGVCVVGCGGDRDFRGGCG